MSNAATASPISHVDEVRREIEAILATSERSALAVGSCLGEIVRQSEDFIGQIQSQVGNLGSQQDDSASATLSAQCRIVERFLGELRRGIGAQSTVADQVLESSKLVSSAAQSVQDVAIKAKVLCLNTMIEAARLGDAGRPLTVIAGQMRALSDSIATSNQRITQISEQLVPLLDEVKKKSAALQQRTDAFGGDFEEQRQRIGFVTQRLQDATQSMLGASDEKLAIILERTNESLESLQTNDIVAQRLRRVLRLLDGESDVPLVGDDSGGHGAEGRAGEAIREGRATAGFLSEDLDGRSGLQSGDIELF